MAETKQKKAALEGNVKVPKELDRAIEAEAFRLDVFKYEIVERAWRAYKSDASVIDVRAPTPLAAGEFAYAESRAVADGVETLMQAGCAAEVGAILALVRSLVEKCDKPKDKRAEAGAK